MAFPLTLKLDLVSSPERERTPIYVRIAELLAAEIRRGRVKPGDRLPGSRSLSDQLGVGRNTVVAAYAELVAEGWIETRPAGGSFVSREVPERRARRLRGVSTGKTRARAPSFEFERRTLLRAEDPIPAALALFGGTPDLRLFPTELLSRAYRRALHGAGRSNLAYAGPFGHERLRTALAEWASATRALSVRSDGILVTRGSQMALDLIARTLLRPGDRIGVEEVGYRPAWAAFEQAGARLEPLPLDRQGLDVNALEAALGRAPIRAVYVTPHHQYPTTVSLAPGRRLRLLELAAKHRFAIIEDDYDHEFHYEGRPLASLAGADEHGSVIYVGTLAKVLAPGLRLGFIAAPEALIESLAAVRYLIDRQGDPTIERAVAELLEDGEVARHARRVRRIYHARRNAFAALLSRHLTSALSFDLPAGGMTFWCKADPRIDTARWFERARRRGVAFSLGNGFVAPQLNARKSRDYGRFLRLGFTQYDEAELEEAVKRMALAL